MKTKMILIAGIAAIIVFPQELRAQIKFGVHGGINFETQAELGQLWNNCEVYPGYMLGGLLEYKTGRNISVQAELNYQTKGEKTSDVFNGENSISKRKLNYISVPVLIKENIHDAGLGERWDLVFFAGPYGGYLVSANSEIREGNTTHKKNIEDQTEKTDFGALLGGGVTYHLSNGKTVNAELRYEMGLSKIDKQDPDLRNKGLGLTIGYSF